MVSIEKAFMSFWISRILEGTIHHAVIDEISLTGTYKIETLTRHSFTVFPSNKNSKNVLKIG